MERERVDIGVGRIGRCATRKSNERIPHPVEPSKNRIAPPKTAETEDSRDRGPSRVHNIRPQGSGLYAYTFGSKHLRATALLTHPAKLGN